MADKESGNKGFFGKLLSAISGAPSPISTNEEKEGQFAPQEKAPLDVRFVQQFTHNGGNFVYCGTKNELIDSLKAIITENDLLSVGSPDDNIVSFLKSAKVPNFEPNVGDMDTICTYCEAMIAYNGGIMINEYQTKGLRIDKMPTHHIVIGKTSQLVENLHGAMSLVNQHYRNNRPGQISVLKGAKDPQVKQASADPNKNRVLYLLLIEDTF